MLFLAFLFVFHPILPHPCTAELVPSLPIHSHYPEGDSGIFTYHLRWLLSSTCFDDSLATSDMFHLLASTIWNSALLSIPLSLSQLTIGIPILWINGLILSANLFITMFMLPLRLSLLPLPIYAFLIYIFFTIRSVLLPLFNIEPFGPCLSRIPRSSDIYFSLVAPPYPPLSTIIL